MCRTVHGSVRDRGNTTLACSTCILDSISTTPEAAYALRKLKAAYAGNAVTVRRSSDSTTSNIGFLADGALNTASLLSFCAATNCYVTTWYDQSGNGKDAVQTTTAQQPQIVASGSLETFQSLPTLLGSTSQLCIVGCSTNTTFVMGYVNSVLQVSSASGILEVFRQAPTSSGGEQAMRFDFSLTLFDVYSLTYNRIRAGSPAASTPYIYSFDFTAALWVNGVSIGSNSPWGTTPTVGHAALFATPDTPSEYFVGVMSEFYIFSTNIADKTTLQHNQECISAFLEARHHDEAALIGVTKWGRRRVK